MVDLMFRDESSHVIKKAQAKQQRRRKASGRTPEPVASPRLDASTSTSVSSPSSSAASSLLQPPLRPSTIADNPPTHPNTVVLPVSSTDVDRVDESERGPALSAFPRHTSQQPPKPEQPKQLVWTRDEHLLPSPEAGNWPSTPQVALMYDIEPTCQERGTAFFFSRYVTIDENASHQRFDFLYDIWRPASPAGTQQLDGVLASMTAVGLVGISHLTHSEEVIDSARKSYGTALCLTNAALRDPQEAIKDTTMLSVLILGVFEMMAEPGVKTMKTWQDHINGALELAKLRGASQFQTRAGVRMFNMLCESITISCMQRHVPMPPEVVALQAQLFSHGALEQEPGSFGGIDLTKPIYKLLQARHDVTTMNLMNNLDDVLARLDDIEAEFDRTISSFPVDCYYKVFKVTKAHKAVFRDTCHVYPSVATASVWNRLRSGRILVLETVLAAIRQRFADAGDEDGELVPQKYATAYRQAWAKLERVNAAIVASVPQQFGLLNPVNPYFDSLKLMPTVAAPLSTTEVREPPTPPAQSPISSVGSAPTPSHHPDERSGETAGSHAGHDDEEVVFDDGGPSLQNPTRAHNPDEEARRYMLLASATNAAVWPLFAVGVSSVCSPHLKEYVVARLAAIYDETGLSQARAIASIVRNRQLVKSPLHTLSLKASNHMPPPFLAAGQKNLGAREFPVKGEAKGGA
ncbi:c6 zinc finger domain containing protein [Niveomyces insectorum RCEF 264]|uniref:C6 zinc finger domain containing protein n=1 Tax=Niveomyces insectorum RCEF 264 TaxID=1081102 RepID=A0A167QWX3_9HYPO|nr:c6 zinc finger domain containing protein [Niveomyces insectorum RCEF 264]